MSDFVTSKLPPLEEKVRRPAPGTAPGTLVSAEDSAPSQIYALSYHGAEVRERSLEPDTDFTKWQQQNEVTWIDVQGLADLGRLTALADAFGLHPLVLADIVHTHQRPKVESYDDHLFIVLRMPHAEPRLWTEQVSLVLGPNYVITFQERAGDCFDPVRQRLHTPSARIRAAGADYLAYALIDAIIDSYFPLLETYGELIEDLEASVMLNPEPNIARRVHAVKRELITLRRALWPQREMVNQLLREEHACIQAETRIYLRDCYDHSVQSLDMLEIYREIASGLVDFYVSCVSTRMNEIMKVLTIIATIFIPLGFIASLYGMNFDRASPYNMPELGWRFGYPFALGLMLAVAGGLLWQFRKKGWLGETHRREDPDDT